MKGSSAGDQQQAAKEECNPGQKLNRDRLGENHAAQQRRDCEGQRHERIGARKRDEGEEPYPKDSECDIKRNRSQEISIADETKGALGAGTIGLISKGSGLKQHL